VSQGNLLLEARDLQVRRGGAEVLSISSFTLHENETVALIGPNGAGKSSLMLSLAGLIEPASGRILFRNEPVLSGSATTGYRRRIAMVFQEPLLFDTTVFGNVASGLKLRGLSRNEIRKRVDACLQRFRIAHLAERSARKLSGGEAQRTSLARAFATQPEMVLLDEPFVALDPPTRQALTDDLEQILRESGTAAIISTHDQAEALRLADRMMVMNGGKIVQTGPPSDVMNHPATEFVAAFVGMENIFTGTATTTGSGLVSMALNGRHVEFMGDGAPGENVVICIRPEHVVVTTDDPDRHTSARNVFRGMVVRIVPLGLFNKVYLDCGFTLVATVTNQSREELQLTPGMHVFASFKATSVHLFRKGY
jgi:tungstate transport system ATP-binding protein